MTLCRRAALAATTVAVAASLAGPPAAPAGTRAKPVVLKEYRLPAAKLDRLRDRWLQRLAARYPSGGWAPLRVDLTNRDLALMGLPPKKRLLARRHAQVTKVDRKRSKRGKGGGKPDGGSSSSTAVATFAGTGFFGIRPGAWVLLLSDGGVGWCSLAHVYGSPDRYKISTAGHCGKVGDVATAIGVVGNDRLVLLHFGKFSKSHDNGLGDDWGLIDVDPAFQHLVTPTMAFWGGPRGMYTATGDLTSVSLFKGNRLEPQVSLNPDPFLAQQIVHYGHGLGVGPGGTPRSGTAIAWRPKHFMFFGAISPGDSGSGANALTGDSVGANMEAAGIMTHLWIDPLMRSGLGVMGGTRSTQVPATLADGQIVPYPAPAPDLP